MHEYSIVQALLERVEREAAAYAEPRVTEVRVRIGELAGVEVTLLRKAYEVFKERTVARHAPLVVARSPARWTCTRCGSDVTAALRHRCAGCDRPGRLASGDEILLERIAMEVA